MTSQADRLPGDKILVVSLHDVHAGSREAIEEQLFELTRLGVKNSSLLVVPCYHHRGMIDEEGEVVRWLSERQNLGDELVVHGFYHDRADRDGGSWFFTKLYTANEAEFLDLPDEECVRRIDQARELWGRLGWKALGFIAPAWLMPLEQFSILKNKGFLYTNTLKQFFPLPDGAPLPCQSLCYSTRAKWRIAASLVWNPLLLRKQMGKNRLLRLSLHPGDFRIPRVKRQILAMVEAILGEGYQPATYAELAARGFYFR